MIGIDQRVTDDDVEERLQDLTSLWVDRAGDTFDSSTTSQTTDSWLGDSSEHVFLFGPVFGFSKSFAFSFTGHYETEICQQKTNYAFSLCDVGGWGEEPGRPQLPSTKYWYDMMQKLHFIFSGHMNKIENKWR